MGDFILVDREFELLADQVNRYCTNLESGLNQYYDILQTIAGSAIASGATHDAILCFNNYVKGAQEAATGIGGKFANLTSSFISEVDAADSYLYETGLSSVRDFSDAEYQQLERREFQNEDGLKLQYRLYKPKTKKGVKYPLILFMHGAGEGGTDNDSQVRGLDVYLHLIFSETGKKNPAFLVAPQCPPNRGWAADDLKDAFVNCAHDLVHALEKEFPIDKRRIYVTGVSMGGHGVYQWLLHFADETAAAIPVCGWIDTDQLCAVPAMKNKPVWIFHGDLDTAVNVECGRRAYADPLRHCHLPQLPHRLQLHGQGRLPL